MKLTLLKHLDHTIEKTTGTSPNTITSSQKHTRHLKHLAKTQQEWAEYLQSKKLKTDTKYQGTKIFLTNENGNNDQLQHTTHTNTKTQTSQRRLGQMVQRHA